MSKNNFELSEHKSFIFDIEGVLIDSVSKQFDAFKGAIYLEGNELAQELLLINMQRIKQENPNKFETWNEFTKEHYDTLISGRSRTDGFRNLLGLKKESECTKEQNNLIAKLSQDKDNVFQEMLLTNYIKPFSGCEKFLINLQNHGIKLGFASGSSNAALMLLKAGLLHYFDFGVLKGRGEFSDKYIQIDISRIPHNSQEIPEETTSICNPQFKGKPNPDIFLHVAKLMRVNPEESVVLEDSPQVIAKKVIYKEAFALLIGVDTSMAFREVESEQGLLITESISNLNKLMFSKQTKQIKLAENRYCNFPKLQSNVNLQRLQEDQDLPDSKNSYN